MIFLYRLLRINPYFLFLFLLIVSYVFLFFFFFQAEDGIRDYKVTGVQTCALPISPILPRLLLPQMVRINHELVFQPVGIAKERRVITFIVLRAVAGRVIDDAVSGDRKSVV